MRKERSQGGGKSNCSNGQYIYDRLLQSEPLLFLDRRHTLYPTWYPSYWHVMERVRCLEATISFLRAQLRVAYAALESAEQRAKAAEKLAAAAVAVTPNRDPPINQKRDHQEVDDDTGSRSEKIPELKKRREHQAYGHAIPTTNEPELHTPKSKPERHSSQVCLKPNDSYSDDPESDQHTLRKPEQMKSLLPVRALHTLQVVILTNCPRGRSLSIFGPRKRDCQPRAEATDDQPIQDRRE